MGERQRPDAPPAAKTRIMIGSARAAPAGCRLRDAACGMPPQRRRPLSHGGRPDERAEEEPVSEPLSQPLSSNERAK